MILDVGCGACSFRSLLGENIRYVGIDIKEDNNREEKVFVWDVNSGFPANFAKKKFDYIVALAFIEHIKQPMKFLKECRRVLNKSGKIIITIPHPVGEVFHKLGSRIGLFSKEANEEHKKLIGLGEMKSMCKLSGLRINKYKKFLFGFNQLFVLKKCEFFDELTI